MKIHEYLKYTFKAGNWFDIKYRILHDFRASATYEKKSSDDFKDLLKFKLLANFDVNLICSPGGVRNLTINILLLLLSAMRSG